MHAVRASLLAVVLLLGSGRGPVRADVIYGLSGVTLADGGTASGYFTLNVYGFLDLFDVVTTPGVSGPFTTGYEYTNGMPGSIFDGTLLVLARTGYVGELSLMFALPLDPQSNIDPVVVGADSFECDSYVSGNSCSGNQRFVTAGVAVPEPGTAMLLAAGLLGVARRRRAA